MIKLFLLLTLTLLLHSAGGQEWKVLYDRALKEHSAGKFNEALATAVEAVKVSKAEFGNSHPDVAECIQFLGTM